MIELAVFLILIVAADVLNPVLAAAVIYALSTRRPYSRTFWVLSGWVTVYFGVGVGIAVGLNALTRLLAGPRPSAVAIELPIGVLLVWFAYNSAVTGEQNKKTKQAVARLTQTGEQRGYDLGTGAAFVLGATINWIGLQFAIPYFAAIDQVLKADMSVAAAVTILAIYNLMYVLPFALLAVLRLIFHKKANALFERTSGFMEKASAVILPPLLFAIGAALIVDAVWYFTTGEILINTG